MVERGTLAIYYYDANGVYTHREMLRGYFQDNGDCVYHVPRNATFENPWWNGSLRPGTVAVFDEKLRVWNHIEDHRGETWFDRRDEPQKINRIGNPLTWGLRRESRFQGVGPHG